MGAGDERKKYFPFGNILPLFLYYYVPFIFGYVWLALSSPKRKEALFFFHVYRTNLPSHSCFWLEEIS